MFYYETYLYKDISCDCNQLHEPHEGIFLNIFSDINYILKDTNTFTYGTKSAAVGRNLFGFFSLKTIIVYISYIDCITINLHLMLNRNIVIMIV